jgi:hypothetical protein
MEHGAHEGDDLNGLSQTHVITENSTSIAGVAITEKPHPLLLVVSQVLVDHGWDLEKVHLKS